VWEGEHDSLFSKLVKLRKTARAQISCHSPLSYNELQNCARVQPETHTPYKKELCMSAELTKETADLLDAFLESERPKVSEQGFNHLRTTAFLVARWFDDQELGLTETKITDAVRYQAWLSEHRMDNGKPYSSGTMQNYLKVVRRMFDYLMSLELVATNPFRELKMPKTGEHISANILSVEQMGKLLDYLRRFDEQPTWRQHLTYYKMHVVAELMYATGMRVSEAASLEPSDLNLDERLVRIRFGKDGKPRTAYLTTYAVQVLRHYLPVRTRMFQGHQRTCPHALFGSSYIRLTQFVNEVLAKTCKPLSLPPATSHSFRHSLGTHLLKAGCDMRHIQVILGHEALHSTQVYTKVDKDDLRRVVDEAHPRSRWTGGQHET
jgi:integrase/recombinase XerC